ncbi:hypothetical protein [Pseudomonas phage pPA-3099-2aT.3]|nr:hypothetical protein [Pseudomonas phage pPA-3099-2aT.3]
MLIDAVSAADVVISFGLPGHVVTPCRYCKK